MLRSARRGHLDPGEPGSFVFRARLHDVGEKTVLGRRVPGRRRHRGGRSARSGCSPCIRRRRITSPPALPRLVADEPPPALVERVAAAVPRDGRRPARDRPGRRHERRVLRSAVLPREGQVAVRVRRLRACAPRAARPTAEASPRRSPRWASRSTSASRRRATPTPPRPGSIRGALVARLNFALSLDLGPHPGNLVRGADAAPRRIRPLDPGGRPAPARNRHVDPDRPHHQPSG